MADQQQQKQSKPEKKKKQKAVSVKLPNARKSIRRQRQMAQGKANYEGIMALIGGLLLIGIIAFVLMGGINQRKTFETIGEWSKNIGEKVNGWFNPNDIVVNDDGIYYKPNSCAGRAGNQVTTTTEPETNEEPEEIPNPEK